MVIQHPATQGIVTAAVQGSVLAGVGGPPKLCLLNKFNFILVSFYGVVSCKPNDGWVSCCLFFSLHV